MARARSVDVRAVEPGRRQPSAEWPSARAHRLRVLVDRAPLMVAMWAGIFLGFFDKTAPGTLDDPPSPAGRAGVRRHQGAAGRLPKAFETTDHVDRAKVVARSNSILARHGGRLTAFAPTQDRDGR